MKFSNLFIVVTLFFWLATAGCATQNSYIYPKSVQERYTITTGNVNRPYQSLGYVQLTKKGFDLLAVIPVVSADLETIFSDELIPVLKKSGADGIINVQFHELQWTPAERIGLLFTVVGIFWIPTKVQLTGELIRYTQAP